MAGQRTGGPLTASSSRQNPDSRRDKDTSRKTARKRDVRRGLTNRAFRAILRLALRSTFWVFIRLTIVFFLVFGPWTAHYFNQLPPARELMDDRSRGSITLLDHTGNVFAWRGDQFGGLVTSDTVSKHLKNAIIAAEDRRFYRHYGLSLLGIAGAIRINIREGRSPLSGHGGSTITQQVAKRVFFPDLKSIDRKIREIPMAFAMELKYSKDEILGIYLNRVYLGAGAFGFEAASQRFFGKSARDVNAPEAAMLAGLLKAPSRYAPTRNLDRARDRARIVINQMEDQGYLDAMEATHARNNPARLSAVAARQAGGYFADWILDSGPSFLLKDTNEDVVIATTFDRNVQEAAEDALNHILQTKVRPGSGVDSAIVVMSPNGEVRAIVGGRKNGVPGVFNRATQALRQTGSAFKPFVFATALDAGYSHNSVVVDSPVTINVPGSGNWRPRNYRDEYLGTTTFATALAQSANSATVRVSERLGRENVRDVAQGFGIGSAIGTGPAIALGTSEATLLEMTAAYAGILNGGRAVAPFGLRSLTIQGESTPLMDSSPEEGERVIGERAAHQLIYMLNQVVVNGTGQRALLSDRQVAGKTGTTQGARDAWFIGFTADYVAGVWMGYDNNTKLVGVTGGGLPADIWRETMSRIHAGLASRSLPMSVPRVEVDQQVPLLTGNGSRAGPRDAGSGSDDRPALVRMIDRLLRLERD